ncbi:MAG: hypothetical protein COS84_01995 [Armatimonadetes bacterium CG07_land_8_20_14_0_80_40_9]|nr:MAG: hypothetical protein COS84_01995 [Armatimonadetes bacterium CG07_land_8_20_14_0_80_40_9]
MDATKILKRVGIDESESITHFSAEEALGSLIECIEEYCPNLQIDKLSKKEFTILLENYSDCILTFHPEGMHQERGALLQSEEILRKYGLSDDDIKVLDFC